jgi:hypothetical protein
MGMSTIRVLYSPPLEGCREAAGWLGVVGVVVVVVVVERWLLDTRKFFRLVC